MVSSVTMSFGCTVRRPRGNEPILGLGVRGVETEEHLESLEQLPDGGERLGRR